jgi:hypothetical protein
MAYCVANTGILHLDKHFVPPNLIQNDRPHLKPVAGFLGDERLCGDVGG